MFERFTDRARRVVVLAQEEARLLGHNYIGSEHVLLGLIREEQGLAARTLESLGISLDDVRIRVEQIVGRGNASAAWHIPFTPRAKKILELSLKEALQLGHNYIGTEHILLGLIREAEGVGAQVLVRLGAELEVVRQRVVEQLSEYTAAEGEPDPEGMSVRAPRCGRCSSPLLEVARFATEDVREAHADEIRPFLFLYCARCGSVVSAWPEPPEGVTGPE